MKRTCRTCRQYVRECGKDYCVDYDGSRLSIHPDASADGCPFYVEDKPKKRGEPVSKPSVKAAIKCLAVELKWLAHMREAGFAGTISAIEKEQIEIALRVLREYERGRKAE